MRPEDVFEVQRLFPQIYLACHVDHVRAASTAWDLSSHDSTILVHLDRENAISPRALAAHLSVAASTLSGAIARSAASVPDQQILSRRTNDSASAAYARGAQAIASTSVLD